MKGKEAFEDELRAQLDEWSAIVDRLRAKVEAEFGEVRMNLMAEIEELATYQRRAEAYLQEVHQAQGDAWKDMKSDIESTRAEMRRALDRAWKRIQISPTAAERATDDEAADPAPVTGRPS